MNFNSAIDSRAHPIASRIPLSVWKRYFWSQISDDILIAMQQPLTALNLESIKNLASYGKYKWWLALSYGNPLPKDEEIYELAASLELSEQELFVLAIQAGRLSLVETIIHQKSDEKDEIVVWILDNNRDIFYSAVEGGDVNLVEVLLKCLTRDDIGQMIRSNQYRLFRLAAEKGPFLVVQRLMACLPDMALNMICAENYAALSAAAIHGHLDIFEYFEGVLGEQGMTIVQGIVGKIFPSAAENGCLNVINALIKRFSSNQISDMIRANNYHPIRLAASNGQVAVVERLMDYLPEEHPEMIKAGKYHVVLEAARYGHLDVIKAVVKRCPKHEPLPNWEAFQIAVIARRIDITNYFLAFPEVYCFAKQEEARFGAYIQHFEQQLPEIRPRQNYVMYSLKKTPSVNSASTTEQGISATSLSPTPKIA